jgi:hypothetical protein
MGIFMGKKRNLEYKPFTRDEGTIGGMELWVHAETATFIPEFLSMEDGSVLRAYPSSASQEKIVRKPFGTKRQR